MLTTDLRDKLAELHAERETVAKQAVRGSFDARLDLIDVNRRIDAALDEMLADG